MTIFYVRPPTPDEVSILHGAVIATRSREDIHETARQLKDRVDRAKGRVADAYKNYSEDTFEGGQVIVKAETELEAAELLFAEVSLKVAWEQSGQWRRVNSFRATEGIIARTKHLLAAIDWKNIRSHKWRKA